MRIEDLRIDKIMKIKINYQEFKADMVKIQSQAMEFARIAEESIKKKISKISNNKSSRISTKEFNSEEP